MRDRNVHPPCKSTNCGTTTGYDHSQECKDEYDEASGFDSINPLTECEVCANIGIHDPLGQANREIEAMYTRETIDLLKVQLSKPKRFRFPWKITITRRTK